MYLVNKDELKIKILNSFEFKSEGSEGLDGSKDLHLAKWMVNMIKSFGSKDSLNPLELCSLKFLDIGVNDGLFSLELGKYFDTYAFEPKKKLAAMLSMNTIIKEVEDRCTVYPLDLLDPKDPSGSFENIWKVLNPPNPPNPPDLKDPKGSETFGTSFFVKIGFNLECGSKQVLKGFGSYLKNVKFIVFKGIKNPSDKIYLSSPEGIQSLKVLKEFIEFLASEGFKVINLEGSDNYLFGTKD